MKTIHSFLIVGLLATGTWLIWAMIPHEPTGPVSLTIERGDDAEGAPRLSEERVAQCPAFARALDEAGEKGRSTLFDRHDIRCATQVLEETLGEDWSQYSPAVWKDSSYTFHATIA